MATTAKKVYDYNADAVRTKIVDVFRARRNEGTVADVIAATGLPKVQIDEQLPAVADEFSARIKATESGEILYSFPKGMKSRYRGFGPGLKRFWKGFKSVGAKVGTLLFKIWICVMLVGYFVLFLAIALIALLLSVAVSVSGGSSDNRRRDDGGGFVGFMIAGRLLDFMINLWFYNSLFDELDGTADERRYRKAAARKNKRPLYQAIFSFVFGEVDPNAGRDTLERKAVIAFLQTHKGIITTDEFMAITGYAPEVADEKLTRYLVEFEGEPRVSEEGTIYYAFESLMRGKFNTAPTNRVERPYQVETPFEKVQERPAALPARKLRRFSVNPQKSNIWYCVFNGVNLLFGSYFLYGSLAFGAASLAENHRLGFDYLYAVALVLFSSNTSVVFWALGIVPVAFAVFFYLIPALRKARLDRENEAIKTENLRHVVYDRLFASPESVSPEAIPVLAPEATPADPAKAKTAIVASLSAARGADVITAGPPVVYSFPDIARARRDIEKVRSGIDTSRFAIGATVFDSGD